MVIFLNGGNSYEQKEMVFERQIDDCIGRAEPVGWHTNKKIRHNHQIIIAGISNFCIIHHHENTNTIQAVSAQSIAIASA